MFEFTIDVEVGAPIEDVFDRVAKIAEYSDWLPAEGEWKTCEGPAETVRLGSVYKDKGKAGTFHGEVVDFNRPTTLAFRQTLKKLGLPLFEVVQTNTFEAREQATLVRHHFWAKLRGPMNLLKSSVSKTCRAERQRVLDALQASFQAKQ